jgi:hypothetical protein
MVRLLMIIILTIIIIINYHYGPIIIIIIDELLLSLSIYLIIIDNEPNYDYGFIVGLYLSIS